AHVVHEFDRAGTIDEGVAVAEKIGRGDRHLDAHVVVARLRTAVADAGARLHRALALDRSGARENCFEQRGLAALEWAHQRNAPGTLRTIAVLSHQPPPRGPLLVLVAAVLPRACPPSSQAIGSLARGRDSAPQAHRKLPAQKVSGINCGAGFFGSS